MVLNETKMWCKYTYLSAKRQTILCKVFAKNENSTLFLQKSTLFSQKSTLLSAKVHTRSVAGVFFHFCTFAAFAQITPPQPLPLKRGGECLRGPTYQTFEGVPTGSKLSGIWWGMPKGPTYQAYIPTLTYNERTCGRSQYPRVHVGAAAPRPFLRGGVGVGATYQTFGGE